RREMGSTLAYRLLEAPWRLPIPMVLDLDVTRQYREPTDVSRKLVASVARRAFWTAPPARDEDGRPREGGKVKSAKGYRGTADVRTTYELAQALSPYAKHKHYPYFLGEFNGSGELLDELDPFLYWYLPIVTVPDSSPVHGMYSRADVPAIRALDPAPKNGMLLDCLEMHAAGRPAPADKAKEKKK